MLTQAETPQAAFAASAVDPAPSQPESQGTEAAAAVAAEQPKRSRTGFVVLAALAVAALAAILGFNMRPSALPAPSEQPAIEREVEVEEQEADQETQEDADAQTPLPQGDMQLMEGAGLAFNLPANWVKASENEQRALFSPSNPDENSLVLAANYRYPGGVILDDSELETALQQFAVGLLEGDEFSDATVESIERRTIAGMPAYQVKAQANASGEAMELYTLAVGTNERLWSVVAGADRASFAAAKPLFDEVMSSLRVTAAPVANPATAAASTDAMDVLRSFGEFEETQHDGTGTVLFTSPLYKMPFLMKVSHTGNGAFSVTSLDDNQEWADTLVSAIGNYSGTISNYLFYDQCSYVSVEAEPDAQWQISFVPFTEVDGLVNGGHYAGDGVYLVDAAALQQMRFAHEGSGPLSVWAFSLTEQPAYGQLLNQDGTFDITVPWDQAKSVIMVNGAGNWSVSW